MALRTVVDFLQSRGIEDPEKFYDGLSVVGKDKADRLANGDIHSNEITFEEEFNKFVEELPYWKNESHFGSKKRKSDDNTVVQKFWTQFSEDQFSKVMVIRKQNSGLCYLHAPVVLEHYLISFASSCENVEMINIGLYEATLLDSDSLKQFLLHDRGGDSVSELCRMCDLDAIEDTKSYTIPDFKEDYEEHKQICDKVLNRLGTQPALVSSFKVYDDFMGGGVAFYHRPSGNLLGRHRMVLIGGRKDESGEYFFLLQNWWQGRYFIEVSASYMYYCGAVITFVKKDFTRTRNWPSLRASYAETCVDSAENLPEKTL